MDRMIKTALFWAFIAISAMLLWQVVRANSPSGHTPEINYSTFMSRAEAGDIARVTISGTRIEGVYRNGKGNFRLTGPNNPGVYLGALQNRGVEIEFREAEPQNLPLKLLGTWMPLILLGALWFFMIRQQQIRRRRDPPNASGGSLDAPGGFR
jgi:cell division protease FtsH